MSRYTEKVLATSGAEVHEPESCAGGELVQIKRPHVPLIGVRTGVDPQGMVRGAKGRVKKIHDERSSACSASLRGLPGWPREAGAIQELRPGFAPRAHVEESAFEDVSAWPRRQRHLASGVERQMGNDRAGQRIENLKTHQSSRLQRDAADQDSHREADELLG